MSYSSLNLFAMLFYFIPWRVIITLIPLIVLYILFFRYKSKANFEINRLKSEVNYLKSTIKLGVGRDVSVDATVDSLPKDVVIDDASRDVGTVPAKDVAYSEVRDHMVDSRTPEHVQEDVPDYMNKSYNAASDITTPDITTPDITKFGAKSSDTKPALPSSVGIYKRVSPTQIMLDRRKQQRSSASGAGANDSSSSVSPRVPAGTYSSIPNSTYERTNGVYTAAVNFIKGGNVWVLIGTIFVLIGLTFSYRYISKIYHIPEIVRIVAGIVISSAIFAVGWRQRGKDARRIFSLIMQGAGIALTCFTIFAAAKFYYIIDPTVAIILISVVLIIGFIIAVLEDSQVFAIIIAVISFATPLLLSTGSNNYVGLFSYYTIIVAGILFIATKRSWRYLNSIAVFSVSVVALMWGSAYYYDSEPLILEVFLITFFLLFNAIVILSALRKPSQKVETTVAVTVSFIAASMQFHIINNLDFLSNSQGFDIYSFLSKHGLALSSFMIGLFYMVFSIILSKKYREKVPALISVYLALGILFLNMTIPFMTKGFWLPMIWAIEGVVLLLLGVKQDNRTFKLFGIALGIFASVQAIGNYYNYMHDVMYYGAYYGREGALHSSWAFINFAWICLFVSSMALLISTTYLRKLPHIFYRVASYIMLTLSYFTIFIGSIYEIIYGVNKDIKLSVALLMTLSITSFIYAFAGRRAVWKFLEPVKYLPALYMVILVPNTLYVLSQAEFSIYYLSASPYNGVGILIFFTTQIILLLYLGINVPDSRALHTSVDDQDRLLEYTPNKFNYAWTTIFYIVTLYFFTVNISSIVQDLFKVDDMAYFSIVLSAVIIVAILIPDRFLSFNQYPKALKKWAIWILVLYIMLNSLYYSVFFGRSVITWEHVIPYHHLLLILLFTVWYLVAKTNKVPNLDIKKGGRHDKVTKIVLGGSWFVLMHIFIARFAVMIDGGNYSLTQYFHLPLYQLLVAILWAIVGFALMLTGNKMFKRVLWILGAVLLSCDILKVMIIDLSNAGTLPRIGSFLGVGLLLIVIGYFVPLPPKIDDVELLKARSLGER